MYGAERIDAIAECSDVELVRSAKLSELELVWREGDFPGELSIEINRKQWAFEPGHFERDLSPIAVERAMIRDITRVKRQALVSPIAE
jgi:hypothetical protein